MFSHKFVKHAQIEWSPLIIVDPRNEQSLRFCTDCGKVIPVSGCDPSQDTLAGQVQ